MKKVFTFILSYSVLSILAGTGMAASSITTNINKLAVSPKAAVDSPAFFQQYNAAEAGKAADKVVPTALGKDFTEPVLQVIQKISPNNFLFGQEDFSKKLLSAFEKKMPKLPEVFVKLTPEMSGVDVLVQIAKNMSQDKGLQASGISSIDDAELAAFAPALEAIRKMEKKSPAPTGPKDASAPLAKVQENLKK